MSSSVPNSFISIRDKKEDIRKKISKAHCIGGEIKDNSILAITKLIIFPMFEKIEIKRSEKFGGSIYYDSYDKLENDFKSKKIHSLDLKNSVAEYLEKIIAPIRKAWK